MVTDFRGPLGIYELVQRPAGLDIETTAPAITLPPVSTRGISYRYFEEVRRVRTQVLGLTSKASATTIANTRAR